MTELNTMKTKTDYEESYAEMAFGDGKIIQFSGEFDGGVEIKVEFDMFFLHLGFEIVEAIDAAEMCWHVAVDNHSHAGPRKLIDGSTFSVSRYTDIWINGWSFVKPGSGWRNDPCGSIQLTQKEAELFCEKFWSVIDDDDA